MVGGASGYVGGKARRAEKLAPVGAGGRESVSASLGCGVGGLEASARRCKR